MERGISPRQITLYYLIVDDDDGGVFFGGVKGSIFCMKKGQNDFIFHFSASHLFEERKKINFHFLAHNKMRTDVEVVQFLLNYF